VREGRNVSKIELWRACNLTVLTPCLTGPVDSVVHPDPDPDPAGTEIICKLGSGSVINSGSDSGSRFESGSKLSSASN
jgi:hypothetical protein